MGPPLIGLTMYPPNAAGRFELHREYVESVRRAGGVPVLIAPGEAQLERALSALDGLLLTGGGDIDPACYGGAQHPSIDRVDAPRDETELGLARLVLTSGLPCLCVCRGAQVLNVALGGTLVEHLPDVTDGSVAHTGAAGEAVPHAVRVAAGSRLATITGGGPMAPLSKHHQALGELGAGLVPTAWAPDGVLEAVELPDHPWLLAVQWHPELTAADDERQQKLFDAVVSAAARSREDTRCD